MMKYILAATLLFFLGEKTICQEFNRKIDSLIQSTLIEYGIPSMAVSYVVNDTIIYGIGGTIKSNAELPVSLTDKYHIGSNTKAITSYIAFAFTEDSLIAIDTKFVDLFPDIHPGNPYYSKITLADLLSHTAGIRPYTDLREYKKLPKLSGNLSEKRLQFAQYVLAQDTVVTETYSNAGYVLAALMLEKASGKTIEVLFDEFLRHHGIDYFIGFPNRQDSTYPWGHIGKKRKIRSLPPEDAFSLPDYIMPAGNISMSIVDYSKLTKIYLHGILGQYKDMNQKIFEKMFYAKEPYSYGWANQVNDKGKLVYHSASAGTFLCYSLISSTREFAVAIMMNCANEYQEEGLYVLRDKLFKLRAELQYK